MKKILYHTLIIFMAMLACACSDFDQVALWNKTNDMNSRIVTLEQLCKEMNTNIESIKTILAAQQDGDYITNVSPIYESGVEVGYTITFKKQGAVSLYHGKNGADGTNGVNGADGKDGVDGAVPQISVKLDEDGNYCWTINGEWLTDDAGNKIKAQGTDGKDGADGNPGNDGADGADGSNGADGKDGITPLLKIENGCWYLSLDNGESWSNLGAAVGADGKDGKDGADGKDGRDGDSFFTEVNTDNPDCVVITLTNGTVITIPTWSAFESLKSYCESLNNNILALQTIVNALQDKDYVTSVTPLRNEGIEIGYVITFSKSGSITIYHGKNGTNGTDGKPGADGKDGISPEIGVRQDSDGIFYWTLNGEWLTDASGNKIKAQGTDGKDGSDGKPGADGTDGKPGNNGTDGKDGADAIAPQLKIENDYWFISVDCGKTWTKLGPSKGEDGKDGVNGSDGKDGDSLFSKIDYTTSSEFVEFTLSDGTVIKLPTWAAFEALRSLCMQMNKNISSLQTIVEALQSGDYVKSITPIYENAKEIGYTIVFSKSGAVTIYHGRDGKDGTNGSNGADGKDGITPEIGVRQDTDNIFYWTLNGEWLTDDAGNKIKAQGTDGKDGADGNPGNDGADGVNGSDGKDGITPLLKIENGDWMLSTDNGNTWQNLGRATGEDGKDGTSGDSMFSDVDYSSSSEYVIFTLADGTVIKLPTWSAFEALRTLCNKMNTNISSLQALIEALQNNDYIKATLPVIEDGKEVGYTIIFAKSNPITIYHGKDGTDGKDGASPTVGVAKYSDGIYYWTLNGEWLTDDAGNKIKAQGTDGKDGIDGSDGKDAVAPQLKIDNGYWYLSVDGGATWTQQGKATGEDGKDGADGKDGDSIFQSVTQDEDNVYFTLVDGTVITISKNANSTPAGLTIKIYDGDKLLGTTFNTYLYLGRTLKYEVEGASGNVAVDFRYEADKFWTIEHTKTGSNTGTIKVVAGNESAQKTAKIILQASSGNSSTAMAVLNVTWEYYNP